MADEIAYLVPGSAYPRVHASVSCYLESIAHNAPALKTTSLPAKVVKAPAKPKRPEPVKAYGAVAVYFVRVTSRGRSQSFPTSAKLDAAAVVQSLTFSPDEDQVRIGWQVQGAANVTKGSLEVEGSSGSLFKADIPAADLKLGSGVVEWDGKTSGGDPLSDDESLLKLKLSVEGEGECSTPEAWSYIHVLYPWIEVLLLQAGDEAETPLAKEKYSLLLPNGEVREGELDDDGVLKLPRVPRGECVLKFPNLDGMDLVSEGQKAETLHWMEVELVDETGLPLKGLAYQLTSPDGKVIEGVLDSDGFVHLEGLPEDPGTLVFPEIDERDFIFKGSAPSEVKDAAWIELELLDEAGQPLRSEAYEIELANGTVIEGKLDEEGFLRLEQLPVGSCRVRFPKIDKRDFDLGPSAPTEENQTDWLELELLDEAGRPVGAEAYEVERPDGTLLLGKLDEQGFARLEQLPPGSYTVRFPGIDGQDLDLRSGAAKAGQPEKDAWLELELLDEAGQPLREQPYQLQLPDGEVLEGRLDEDGKLWLEGLAPGECTLTFAQIDTGDWV